jgi:hypothetical protein
MSMTEILEIIIFIKVSFRGMLEEFFVGRLLTEWALANAFAAGRQTDILVGKAGLRAER